ncbi:hypothetical protein GC093_23300 [Paenibacillus sp. LMG 31456]|uniref:SLH domain-containing protein n=1 Tax=Paenibacillus foliorum TaxID=2654974 RepID=A0A972K3P4_9BACL|nr:S-layer homology domain-containing protein [Paenibacillus foliorum]NOU96128.1 hypothetical protein [Paenibacillus foliorum]
MRSIHKVQLFIKLILLTALLFTFAWPAQTSAQTGIAVSTIGDKYQGESVAIGGDVQSAYKEVIVKVFEPGGSLYYFRSVPVQGGRYTTNFLLSSTAALGIYEVLVGYGSDVIRSSFLVLKRNGGDNEEFELEDALNQLSIGFCNGDTWESVTSDFYVLSVGKHETSVSWTSSHPNVIEMGKPQGTTIEGQVKRQKEEKSVVVTATVSKNGRSAQRPFLLIVKSASTSKKSVTERYRTVQVIGERGGFNNPLAITRIELTDGTRIDKTVLDEASTDQVIDKSRETGERVTRLMMDHPPGDIPDEIAVQINAGSITALVNYGMSFQVESDTVVLALARDVLEKMRRQAMDMYFRIVPVRSEGQRQAIGERIASEPLIMEASRLGMPVVVGIPQKIETNYSGYRTRLLIPFNGIVPEHDQAAFLSSLRVFIEHSDGDKQLTEGKIVYKDGKPYGVEIEIDKFSLFTLVRINQSTSTGTGSSHKSNNEPENKLTQATKKLDGDKIVIEHNGTGTGVKKEQFEVEVNGKLVIIVDMVVENGKIILRLDKPVPAGDVVKLLYKGDDSKEAEARKQLFSGPLDNPGKHSAFVQGYPDGTFQPERNVSRGEMAALLSRVYEGAKTTAAGRYPDVAEGHWSFGYVSDAGKIGLMRGMPDGTFQPDRLITRAEMASIVNEWLLLGQRTSQTKASDTQGHWGETRIANVMEAGIMQGYPDGTFQPDRGLSRAEAVTILDRLLKRGPLQGSGKLTWQDVPANHWAFGYIEEASTDHRFESLIEGGERRLD